MGQAASMDLNSTVCTWSQDQQRRTCRLSITAAARLPNADRSQSQDQQRSAVDGPSAATGSVGDRATQGSVQLGGVEISASTALKPLALGTKRMRLGDRMLS